MTFESELEELEFELIQQRRGAQQYSRRSNPYLRWWLLVNGDGTAELSWEFELGEYLKAKGFHVSVQDELSLLLFPRQESRGRSEPGWLKGEIERTERLLQSVDLVGGT